MSFWFLLAPYKTIDYLCGKNGCISNSMFLLINKSRFSLISFALAFNSVPPFSTIALELRKFNPVSFETNFTNSTLLSFQLQ